MENYERSLSFISLVIISIFIKPHLSRHFLSNRGHQSTDIDLILFANYGWTSLVVEARCNARGSATNMYTAEFLMLSCLAPQKNCVRGRKTADRASDFG